MIRSGVFVPALSTDNQCGRVGHPAYNYRIKVVVSGDVPLNERGQVIDHAQIDDLMVNSKISGSCEEMLAKISHLVAEMFDLYGIRWLGIKVDVFPSMSETIAHIDLIYIRPEISENHISVTTVITSLKD